MPWIGAEPWELHMLLPVDPGATPVPAGDTAAWNLASAKHRRIYDKLWLYERLGIECGPSGTEPEEQRANRTLVIKPIANLWGMGLGVDFSDSSEAVPYRPGHLWSWFATGPHFSIDLACHRGHPIDWWATRCHPGGPQGLGPMAFDHFEILDGWGEGRRDVDRAVTAALRVLDTCLPDYTGMLNVEVIGETVIDAHLRFTTQWADLYGRDFLAAVVALYREADPKPFEQGAFEPKGFSVPAWLPGRPALSSERLQAVRFEARAINLDALEYEEDAIPNTKPRAYVCDPGDPAQPPGAYRLAVVNGLDHGSCLQAAVMLRTVVQEGLPAGADIG